MNSDPRCNFFAGSVISVLAIDLDLHQFYSLKVRSDPIFGKVIRLNNKYSPCFFHNETLLLEPNHNLTQCTADP